MLHEPLQKGQFSAEKGPKNSFVTLETFWLRFGVTAVPTFVHRTWVGPTWFRQVLQEALQKSQVNTENAPKYRFVTLGAFWFIFWSRCLQTLSHTIRSFDRIL